MRNQFEPRWAASALPAACIACSTGRLNSWFNSDPEALEILLRERIVSRYSANRVVYGYGEACEGLYCVSSGTLVEERISLGQGARRLHFLEPGDMLGWTDFFAGGGHRGRAVCLTEAMICAVPAEVVRGLIAKNPLLGLKFLGQAAQDLRKSEAVSLSESRTAARCRLASALQAMTQHTNRMPAGETEFTLPLSRRDLADLISVSAESLSWAIRDLENSGMAHFSGRTVRIRNPGRLSGAVKRKDMAAA